MLPLIDAAELAGVSPLSAQAWLSMGRSIASGNGTRRSKLEPGAKLAVALAAKWDSSLAEYAIQVREIVLDHARKSPQVALQLLAAVEKDRERRAKTSTVRELADRTVATSPVAMPDLEERFHPLELAPQKVESARQAWAARHVTTTEPDGTTKTTTEVLAASSPAAPWEEDFEHRTTEDLDYYADHGIWPEDAAPDRLSSEIGKPEAIDAHGDPLEPDAAFSAELEQQLRDGEAQPEAAPPGSPRDPRDPPGITPPANGSHSDHLPPSELGKPLPAPERYEIPGGELVEDAPEPPEPAPRPPSFTPLPRYDPLAS